jgi:antitoxin VapB
MPLNIRTEEINQLAETLARQKHVSKTEAARIALENELSRNEHSLPLRNRLLAR